MRGPAPEIHYIFCVGRRHDDCAIFDNASLYFSAHEAEDREALVYLNRTKVSLRYSCRSFPGLIEYSGNRDLENTQSVVF